MSSIPRILAVDNTNQIADIVRGALTLLDRRHIMVEVPTAEDALDELRSTQVDLMVTAYALPDLSGLELAARSIRESAGTPIIILANPSDPEVAPETLAGASYSYLVRPVGEQFWRALRIGLDGEAAVAAQENNNGSSNALELGPLPELDVKAIREHIVTMLRDTATVEARSVGVIVADRMGRVVMTEGATGYFDKDILAAVLAPAFARTVDLRELVGGNAWSLQFYDGELYDVFALALGLHYFAALVFDNSDRPAYAQVTRYGRREVEAIIEKIGADAWTYRRTVSVKTRTTQGMKVVTPQQLEEAAAQVAAVPAPQSAEPAFAAVPPPPELKLEPVGNMDLDMLFNQNVNEGTFDDMFSADDLNQTNTFLSGSDMVSFDEAINMGILDE